MTKRKRRQKGQAAARREAAAARTGEANAARLAEASPTSRADRGERRSGTQKVAGRRTAGEADDRDRRDRRPPPVVYPSLPVSLARGIRAVGTSPVLLAITFLGTLALWLIYTVHGVALAMSPSGMILLEVLPPFHSLIDVRLLAAGHASSAAPFLGVGIGVLILRAALVSIWIPLIVDSLRSPGEEAVETESPVRRAIGRLAVLLGVEAGMLTLMLAALVVVPSFLGAQLGQLGVIVALLGGTYFLVLAPVIAGCERVRVREAFRIAIRAARIPGPRHMVLAFSYVAFSLFALVSTPASRVAQATPSILVWLYALFVSFLHVSVLAAFTFRWRFVRETVMKAAQGARSARPAR